MEFSAHADAPYPFSNEKVWKAVSEISSLQVYSSSKVLFKQGFPAKEVYLIERGLIKLIHMSDDGQEIIIGLRPAGWMLGVTSVIARRPHTMTAVALTTCYLLKIPADTFRSRVKTDAEFSWNIHQSYNCEAYDQVVQLIGLKGFSARQRFEQLLLQYISSTGVGQQNVASVQLPLKHCEIARLIAVTPEYLSRILKQMQREGLIQRDNDRLVIPDLRKLCHFRDPEE